jgi:teichuronic acid biosynthesis glycosyltransferase TuaC
MRRADPDGVPSFFFRVPRMRLLIVTSQFPIAGEPNRGRPLLQTVRALSELADVRVLSPVATYPRWARPRTYLFREPEARQTIDGIDVEYLTYPALPVLSRPFNGALCGRALDRAMAEFAPDVVLAYWLYPDAYGAMQAARRAGIPFVAGARGSDIRVRDAVSRRFTRPVVRAARRLLVVSEDLGRLAARDYGADPARVRAIPNGCDASIFRLRDRAAARAALGIAADAELVAYVGRLVPEKGLRELLDAAQSLLRTRPRLQLALIGEGPMRAELETRAAALGCPVLLPGAQAPLDVARWMAASDVVTLPSYSEGHPNALVEALACGRPVVATPVGGIPEVVDARSGVLVPVRDAPALARGLDEAMSRDWDAHALAACFSRDWRDVARDTLDACREALAEASGVATARAA